MTTEKTKPIESPDYLRMSLAAALTLDFKKGLFYRNAKLYCINLLLTYEDGCIAKCAYCGLNGRREGAYREKSFIRVSWPTYLLDDIIERIRLRQNRVKRICISMVTRKRAVADTIEICSRLRRSFDVPVSLLIAPTVLKYDDLVAFKKAGADKIGVAIDLATEQLFDKYRGKGVGGPHTWKRYWACLEESLELFGKDNAGPHFMVGMGETEEEMGHAIQRARDLGGSTHLFSFFPEAGSAMENHPQPPMDQYRHIQLVRYLIDDGLSRADRMTWDESGRILDYGLPGGDLESIVDSGEPFRTSGCRGYDGQVACNRPFANSRPGPDMRNYPFPPTPEDVLRIRRQMHFNEAAA
jgi:lipoyl synthase